MAVPTRRLIRNALMVTMDRDRRVIKNGAVLIQNDTIVSIGQSEQFSGIDALAIDADDMIIMPGLVDAHVHLSECLLRNVGIDLPFAEWFGDYLRPFDQSVGAEDIRCAVNLSLLEHLKTGTTTFAESLLPIWAADIAAEAVLRSGLRCALSLLPHNVDDLSRIRASAYKWHDKENRLQIWIGLRAITSIQKHLAHRIADCARALDTRLSWHMSSSRHEGDRVSAIAESYGWLSPNMVAGHCVDLDDEDISRLANSGSHVVHLPVTNAKLGMGLCPVPELLRAGVPVALGSDGDNSHDLFQVMAFAGLLNKSRLRDASALRAETLIEMATIGGARALGLENKIGSLEPGKKADIIMLRTDNPSAQPNINPAGTLVYGAMGSHVDTVIVDGETLLFQGKPLRCDEETILREFSAAATSVMKRANTPRHGRLDWPCLE